MIRKPGFAIRAAIAALTISLSAGEAVAQRVPQPTSPPGSGGLGKKPAPVSGCGGSYAVATVNPYSPASGGNYHTIGKALCAVKPNGKVVVYRDRKQAYQEAIDVRKPGVTIMAADADLGGLIELRPPVGACAVIRPWTPNPKNPQSKAVTTIRGFVFVAPAGSDFPCIDVENGLLELSYSRVDMTDSEATAIHVGYTGELDFVGSSYVEHGIFRNRLSVDPTRRGYGVVAERGPSLSLTNLRLEGLLAAVVSRSEENTLKGVRFVNNSVGVHIADDTFAALYSPNLKIEASRFENNDDGVLLGVGPLGTAEAAGDMKLPFRGAVSIAAEDDSAEVVFVNNRRGLGFVGAYPEQEFRLGRATFSGNAEHALALSLPAGTRATIADTMFAGNGAAIALDGDLDGALALEGSTMIIGSTRPAVAIENGSGSLKAHIASLTGTAPGLRFGAGFFKGSGSGLDINIASKATPEMLAIGPSAPFCTLDISDKKQRAIFAQRFDNLKIVIDGAPLSQHFAKKPGQLKESELKAAQKKLCR